MRTPKCAGAELAAVAVLAAGALAIPTIITSGDEAFRFPKELAFRAEAILLLVAAVFWVTARWRTWRIARGAELAVAAAVLAWTLVTVAFSTNRQLSVDSLITVVAATVIFVVTCVAAQGLSLLAVDVLMIGAVVNAALVILQETNLWTPLKVTIKGHYGSVGLLGNANDVGTFLVAPALAALVMAVTAAGWRRWIYAVMALLLGGGIAASGTRTALVALVAALLVFALTHSWRAAAAVVAAMMLLAIPLLSRKTMIGQNAREVLVAAKTRNYERLLSERLVPFLAAIDMTRDHPLLGVGPGCFKYHFMPYRVALRTHYPEAWTKGFPQHFAEVHNDHLQVASESGLPGYAIFLAAIAIAAGTRRRAAAATPEATFARALRWPLAVAFFVVCLAQFPLELAAPRLMFLSLGALCLAWDRSDAP
ncbi:MAG TPA: O-antigen ligase family protein, partial [Thermoanaerobaculia bacterium]|nr:O-antigen ligase family protein [Thermoanaerobaculia bacterium]